MLLDPNRTVHKTYIEKIDALLTQVLKIPAEESIKLCEKLTVASEEVQKNTLEEILKTIEHIKKSREDAIKKVDSLKKEFIVESEKLENEEAEENLVQVLKNV